MIPRMLQFICPSLTFFATLIAMVVASQSGFSQTKGYYVALLRSECTSAPLSPPAVGQTVVGRDYVMMTVAEGDPLDFTAAQRAVTDATFASLMPKYCGLSRSAGTGCVTNRVQWNVMTYDATGNPKISGGPVSGSHFHTCDVTDVPKGFYVALLRSECTSAPLSPPAVGQTVVGRDYVMMTVAEGDPLDFSAAQQVVTDATFASLMPKYCGLSRATGTGCVTNRVQWNVMTYDATGNPKISGGPASGSHFHTCDVTDVPKGFYVALLRSECTSAPLSPPAVGQTVVGPDYVMMTVAEGDPLDFSAAQQVVTDATFASLMPKYCGLSRTTGTGCVTNRVQWNVMTYDATGNPKISGGPVSGSRFHTCDVTDVPKGFYVALLRSECTSAPLSPPAVGQTVVGPDYVMMTVAEGDPLDFTAAQRAVTDATFASLMPKYCGLSRSTRTGCVTNRVQWNVMTYDATGNPKISGGPVSGGNYHTCDVTNLQPMLASPNVAAVPTLNNGTVTLSFSSQPGLHYVIEYKATFDVTPWTRLNSIDGNGEVLSFRDSGATSSTRFYRIRVE